MDSNFLRRGIKGILMASLGAVGFVTSFVLALALAGVAAVGSGCSSSESVPSINGSDLGLRLNQETVWIVDTRPAEAFDAQHINTGGSVSVVDMDEGLKAAKEDTIVVCGADADDPAVAPLAKKLKERGFTKVFILEGGFAKWVAGGGITRSMKDIPVMARPSRAR